MGRSRRGGLARHWWIDLDAVCICDHSRTRDRVADRAVRWILLASQTSRSSIDSGRPANGLTLRHLPALRIHFPRWPVSAAFRAKTHQRRSWSLREGIERSGRRSPRQQTGRGGKFCEWLLDLSKSKRVSGNRILRVRQQQWRLCAASGRPIAPRTTGRLQADA